INRPDQPTDFIWLVDLTAIPGVAAAFPVSGAIGHFRLPVASVGAPARPSHVFHEVRANSAPRRTTMRFERGHAARGIRPPFRSTRMSHTVLIADDELHLTHILRFKLEQAG